MATPNFGTSKALSSANMNTVCSVEDGAFPKEVGAYIQYNGTSWEVASAYTALGIATTDLAWDTDHVEITLSGFTELPLVHAIGFGPTVSTAGTLSGYETLVDMVDDTASGSYQAHVYFHSAFTVAATEDTDMRACVRIMGN